MTSYYVSLIFLGAMVIWSGSFLVSRFLHDDHSNWTVANTALFLFWLVVFIAKAARRP